MSTFTDISGPGRRSRRSARIGGVTVLRDLPYCPGVKACRLDLFMPGGPGPHPLVVLIHGGGWISGDRDSFHGEAAWFASQGVGAACVSYRLAPLEPFPAACDDVLNAVAHLRNESKLHGIDPSRIIAMGNSAGGHLGCIAGLQRNLSDGSPAQNADAVVAICPITDVRNPEQTHFPISMSFLEQFLGGSHAESPERYAAASPATHVHGGAPPFLIFHGTADDIVPVEQSKSLYIKLCESGVPAELHLLEGEGHSFSYPAWEQIRAQSLEFIQTL